MVSMTLYKTKKIKYTNLIMFLYKHKNERVFKNSKHVTYPTDGMQCSLCCLWLVICRYIVRGYHGDLKLPADRWRCPWRRLEIHKNNATLFY